MGGKLLSDPGFICAAVLVAIVVALLFFPRKAG
jgi:hypothetical protein